MNFKKLLVFLFIMSIIFAFSLIGCSNHQHSQQKKIKPVSKSSFLMGTIVKITIYDQVENKHIFTKAFNRIQEIEDKMTINKRSGKSEIIRLNNASGKDYVILSPDTFLVLEKGKYYARVSNGKFDITIGPIVKLWNIDTDKTTIPNDSLIKDRLPLVNFEKLELDKTNQKGKLLDKNMMVDLGAIAKGYAADEVGRILKAEGIKHAIINLGGNILTLGTKPNGNPWHLGLQDPYEPRGDYMGIIELKGQALVSSGTYEKYLEVNGNRYHHIIDPQTGYPVQNNLVSVSIITENSLDADALSTSIFLLGLEKGMKLVEKLDDVEAIFITVDKKVYVSSGINKDNFKIVKNQYKLQK